MEDLIGLIKAATNPEDINFKAAQEQIIAIENENPIEGIDILTDSAISISQLPEEELQNETNTLFLILEVIKECYKRTIHQTTSLYQPQKTNLEPELYLKTLETTKIFFSANNNTLRRSATNLFSKMLITNIEMIISLNIIDFLIELVSSENTQEVLSGAECLDIISFHYEIPGDNILSSLIEAYVRNSENVSVLKGIIKAISRFIEKITQIFDEEKTNEFINTVLEKIISGELKPVIYNFITECAEQDFALVSNFLKFIFENSINDLQDISNPVIFNVAMAWDAIVKAGTKSKDEEEVDFSEYIENLGPLFLNCLDVIPSDEIPNIEWEPYTPILQVLSRFTRKGSEEMLPLLNEKIECASAENDNSRISAAFCLSILIKPTEGEEETIFQYIQQLLADSCKTVIFYALSALNMLIKKVDDAEIFLPLIENLFIISHDTDLCMFATSSLYEIIQCPNFNEFQIIEGFAQLIQELPLENMRAGLRGFSIATLDTAPQEVVDYALEFLFQVLDSMTEGPVNDVCLCLNNILRKTKFNHTKYFEDGYRILKKWVDEGETTAILPICDFAAHLGNDFVNVLEDIAPVLESYLTSDDSDVVIKGVNAFFSVVNNGSFIDFFNAMIPSVFANFNAGASVDVQDFISSCVSLLLNENRILLTEENVKIIFRSLITYQNQECVANIESYDGDTFGSIVESLLNIMFNLSQKGFVMQCAQIVNSLLCFETVQITQGEMLMKFSNLYKRIPPLVELASKIDTIYSSE